MLEIVCAVIAALATVTVAALQLQSSKERKISEERLQREKEDAEKRSQLRAKESKLSMDMAYATSKLCVGTALAVKRGIANGELDEGLNLVDRATAHYEDFLRELAADRIGS